MRSAKNILLHELIGLNCEITRSRNASHVGLRGRIIDETQKTLLVMAGGRKKRISKKDVIINVVLNGQTVEIVGKYLISRPEDRIKRKFKKW